MEVFFLCDKKIGERRECANCWCETSLLLSSLISMHLIHSLCFGHPRSNRIWSIKVLIRVGEWWIGLCAKKIRRGREGKCNRRESSFLHHIFLPNISSSLLPFIQCPDLIEIRSKIRKEREEEKKKSSSSFHGDLVQIPSDLRERIRVAIFFFKI